MQLSTQSLQEFLEALSAKSPTPGGGAVASLTAALGASLGQMVLRYSQGKKNLAEHAAAHEAALEHFREASHRALELAAADAEAYGRLNALWKLDKDDPKRREQWADAVAGAIDSPQQVLALCMAMLESMRGLAGKTNAMLDSDLAIAAVLAEAAARAAAWNVRINLPLLDDASAAQQAESNLSGVLQRCRALCDEIEQACRQ